MEAWLLDLLTCAACGGRLGARPGGELLACRRCRALYPVLAGVPVLVPEPAGWMARHRESIVATLAEHGAAARRTLALVAAFADAAGPIEPMRFGDDWTPPGGAVPPDPAFARWAADAAARGPIPTMLEMLPRSMEVALDLGTGDGALAAALARRCRRLLVADLSLRAVLRAGRPGVVADAEALPLRPGAFDLVAAAHLFDLLERPADFLVGARRALRPRGRLLLSTPDPTGLDALLPAAGLAIADDRDAIPWLRVHGPRQVQVYFCRVLAAVSRVPRRPTARRAGSGRSR